MKIPAVKGTRDFYPEDWAVQTHIFDAWRTVSIRHGCQEFDGPTLELLDLYVRKSGDEIVDQLFHLEDRAGRRLAMRPELTPTVARMVAARLNALPRPIKWFSIPRLYRGERPQRGRLREFFQWNVDIVGSEEIIADAECIAIAIEGLRALGLTHEDIVIRISDRRLLATLMSAAGIPQDDHAGAYAILDKAADLPPEELDRRWSAGPGKWLPIGGLNDLLAAREISDVERLTRKISGGDVSVTTILEEDKRLLGLLEAMELGAFCSFDLSVVRGLAYYTGPVFECYDRKGAERAIFGGGRYDGLLESVGGGKAPAVGFGMGDVVLALMLGDRGLLPDVRSSVDVYVIPAADEHYESMLTAASRLRRTGLTVDHDFKKRNVSKQMAAANSRNARFALIIGCDVRAGGTVSLKDLSNGTQKEIAFAKIEQHNISQWMSL